jgi:hypothetical protein
MTSIRIRQGNLLQSTIEGQMLCATVRSRHLGLLWLSFTTYSASPPAQLLMAIGRSNRSEQVGYSAGSQSVGAIMKSRTSPGLLTMRQLMGSLVLYGWWRKGGLAIVDPASWTQQRGTNNGK